MATAEQHERTDRRPSPAAGIMYGIGLGGFVDGIVLHQILQWHHLLTATDAHPANTVAGLEANTLADGLFHAAAWIAVLAGLWALWRATRDGATWTFRRLSGLMLAGWGAFNLVEGVVDHHLLRIHHVRDDVSDPLPCDLGFLAFGAVLVSMWCHWRIWWSTIPSTKPPRPMPSRMPGPVSPSP